jgi:hypothetical protein
VDAHTELHHSIRGKVVVPFRHQRLHRDRGLYRLDDARKLDQETVAGILYKPSAVIEDDRVYRASMGLERGVCACLVGAHHSRVTGDVGADYRR